MRSLLNFNSGQMKEWDAFRIFVVARLFSVFQVYTFFVPDEYWQSVEVAHRMSFGYGYLTWEWEKGIRSYVYPLIFSGLFSLLKYCGLDYPDLLIYMPRVLQALLSAYADLCFYRWSGSRKWAIFSTVTSWFWFYTASRTLINTFETALTTIALSQFPWVGKGKDENVKFIWIVALVIFIRPTAAIVWFPICVYHLCISQHGVLSLILTKYLPIAIIVSIFSITLDSIAHGSFVVTFYEFFKFNVFQDIGSFYGTHSWFWYLSAGFPAILGVYFIPFVLATLDILKNRAMHPNELALLGCLVFSILIYSLFPHKEIRFILPLLPICLNISSRFLSVWSLKANVLTVWIVATFLTFGNVAPAFLFSAAFQRGTLDVMKPLRTIANSNPNDTSFLFLMPCHSTPYYSHLHINVSSRFLTCEPNFNNSKTNYLDEADQFYKNPSVWLRKNYPPNGTLPSHIICFDELIPYLTDILSRYKTTHTIPYSDIPVTGTGRSIVINERIGN